LCFLSRSGQRDQQAAFEDREPADHPDHRERAQVRPRQQKNAERQPTASALQIQANSPSIFRAVSWIAPQILQ
jgi:hypothetical protein